MARQSAAPEGIVTPQELLADATRLDAGAELRERIALGCSGVGARLPERLFAVRSAIGPDTWAGPAADQTRGEFEDCHRWLLHGAAELDRFAVALRREADAAREQAVVLRAAAVAPPGAPVAAIVAVPVLTDATPLFAGGPGVGIDSPSATGYVGIDPRRAEDLQLALRRTHDELSMDVAELNGLLAEIGRETVVRSRLQTVMEWLGRTAADVRWRVETVLHNQDPSAPGDMPSAVFPFPDERRAVASARADAAELRRLAKDRKTGALDCLLDDVGTRATDPAYARALAGALGPKGILAVLQYADQDDACALGKAIASASRTGALGPQFHKELLSKHNKDLGNLMRCGQWDVGWAVQGAHLLLQRDDFVWAGEAGWVEPEEPDIAVALLTNTPGAATMFAAEHPKEFAKLMESGLNRVLIEIMRAEQAAARHLEDSLTAFESVLHQLPKADLLASTALELARWVGDNMAGIAQCIRRDADDLDPKAKGLNLSPQTLERVLVPLMDEPAARKEILEEATAWSVAEFAGAATTVGTSARALLEKNPDMPPEEFAESLDVHFIVAATKAVAGLHGVLARATGRKGEEAELDTMKTLTTLALAGAGAVLGPVGATGAILIAGTGHVVDAARERDKAEAADQEAQSQTDLEQDMRKGVRDLVVATLLSQPEVWSRLTAGFPPPSQYTVDARFVIPQLGGEDYTDYDTWLADPDNPISRITGNIDTALNVAFHL